MTPLIFEITERARLVFKRHQFKSVEDDPEGVFSFVPYVVLHNEDIREYSHCRIEEPRNIDILSLYTKNMMDRFENLKLEFKSF